MSFRVTFFGFRSLRLRVLIGSVIGLVDVVGVGGVLGGVVGCEMIGAWVLMM